MLGEFENSVIHVSEHQKQRRQEAEAYRLAKQHRQDGQGYHDALLAGLGAWMARTGERLQARYGDPLELSSDPNIDAQAY